MEFSLRPAAPADLPFARGVFFETQRWAIEQSFGWDEARENEKFARAFDPAKTRIIMAGGAAIGWLQTHADAETVEVLGLYIAGAFQNHGIGSRLIAGLINEAKISGKAVLLSMGRANPAFTLYKRLGFRMVSEEDRTLYLRWDAAA